MKLLILILSLGMLSCGTGSKFKVSSFEEVKLKNGLKIIFIEDDKLPYFSMSMLVRAGAMNDAEETLGTASMVASLLNKGSSKRTATQIADDYGQIGASFSASASQEYTMVSTLGLSLHEDQLIDSFAELLLSPKFSDSELRRLKAQVSAGIKSSVDNPSALVSKSYRKLLFNDGYPYSRPISGTLRSVRKIKKKHILKTYLRHYRPNNSTLAVVGKYSKGVKKKIRDRFEKWQSKDVKPVAKVKPEPFKGRQMYIVDKPGTKQTQIRMGFYGVERTHPDFIGIRIATTILGGAFKSRLMDEIRVKRGLSYGAYARANSETNPDAFVVSTFTKHKSTGETVKVALDVLEDFHKNGITAKELEQAQGLLKGQFPRAIETAEKLATNVLVLRHYGVSESYLSSYMSKVDSYNHSEINNIIKKHLNPEDIKIILMTTKNKIFKQVKDYKPKTVSYKKFL